MKMKMGRNRSETGQGAVNMLRPPFMTQGSQGGSWESGESGGVREGGGVRGWQAETIKHQSSELDWRRF